MACYQRQPTATPWSPDIPESLYSHFTDKETEAANKHSSQHTSLVKLTEPFQNLPGLQMIECLARKNYGELQTCQVPHIMLGTIQRQTVISECPTTEGTVHTHTHTHTHTQGCYCSVTKSCLTLCDLIDCSTPGFSVLHHLPEFAQIHVHWVSDAIQPSYPLSLLLLLPSIFPSIRVFSNKSVLHIMWPKY